MHRLLVTLALIGFLPTVSLADAPALPKKVTTIEGITEYQLENGLKILLFPDESSNKVTVNCTIFVGSRHEGYGETGMAHLLEHMVFKGTPTHKDIPKELRDRGAQFNGTTWVDRTNYYETLPAGDKNLEFGIKLEADRLVNSFIKREDLLTEMTVVRSEFEKGENTPSAILSQRMMGVSYEWHNYGKSTIGNRTDIERVPIDRLQGFYRKYYRPDNAMLIIAGKFDEKKALEYAAKYFGALKKPQAKIESTYTEEPAQDGERMVVLRRVGNVGVVGLLYHIPAGAHADFAPALVYSRALTNQPSGLLYKELVEAKKASEVSGFAMGLHDPGVVEFMAEAGKDKPLDEVRDTMIDVVEKQGKTKITAEEVDRIKRKLLADRERAMSDSNRIGIELSEWAAKGDWRLFFLHRDRLEKVTVKDVQRVAGQLFTRSNRTVGMFIPTAEPERAEIPETPNIADLMKDYKGREVVVQGEKFDPTPENIEKRVQRSKLSSGIDMVVLPKKKRGSRVNAQLRLRFGNEKSLTGHTNAASMLGAMLMRGTSKHTRQQLQDEFDTLKARVSPSSGPGAVTFTIEAPAENLPKVMKLVMEILREPSFPEAEFEIIKQQVKSNIESQMKEPQPLAIVALRRKMSPYPKGSIHYTPTLEESIERVNAVTLDEIKKLYQDQLGGTVGEFSLVGEADLPAIKKILEDGLNGWKSKIAYERIPSQAKTDVPGSTQKINTPDKANAVYAAGHAIAMNDEDPDFGALEVADFLFGGGSLSSRLGNRVRQKEGLSYGVQSSFSADTKDKDGHLMLFAICNPKNMDKVNKAILEELDKLIADGVTDAELDEAKKAYLLRRQMARTSDANLVRSLAKHVYDGRTYEYDAKLEKKISELTPDAVKAAVKKHFDPKRLIIVEAGDFEKK